MNALQTLLLAMGLCLGLHFPSQVQAQCSGASLPNNPQTVCPGGTATYTLQNLQPQYTVYWSTGTYGTILSGQGTASITVQWNFPLNCQNCSPYDFEVTADVTGPSCWDYLFIQQSIGWGGPAPGIYGATTPHAGDTCWYMAEYFDGINSIPSGDFMNIQGGTVINTLVNYGMSNSIFFMIQKYVQVVWGPQGNGSMEFHFWDGIGGCGDVNTLNVNIGPSGSIATRISGPAYVCLDDTAVYTADLHPGSTYQWQVQGAYILSYPAPNQVALLYASQIPHYTDRASIILTETNNGRSKSVHKQVGHSMGGLTGIPLIYGSGSVCNNSQVKYYASAQVDNYAWTVVGGSIVAGQGTDTVLVQWPLFGSGTGSVGIALSSSNCAPISLNKPVNYGGGFANYPQLIAANTAGLGATVNYATSFNAGHSYTWSVSPGGSIQSGQGTNSISVTWNQPGPQTVTVTETGPGCGTLSNTANVNVLGLAVEVSANDSTLQTGYGPQQCATLSVTAQPALSNPTYVWSNGATTPTITVCPTTSTTYSVTVTDPAGTASDDVLIQVENLACGNGGVKICRNLGIFTFTQCVQPLLVPNYLAQGSTLGACPAKTGPQPYREFGFDIAPNPATAQSQVLLAMSAAGDYAVDLLDVEGRVVRTLLAQHLDEGSMLELDLQRDRLSNGMYFLRLQGPGILEVKKWVLQ